MYRTYVFIVCRTDDLRYGIMRLDREHSETYNTANLYKYIVNSFLFFTLIMNAEEDTAGGVLKSEHIRKHINFYRPSSYASAVLGVVIPSVCPSVRPSVTRVLCDKKKQCAEDILIQHQRTITLVF